MAFPLCAEDDQQHGCFQYRATQQAEKLTSTDRSSGTSDLDIFSLNP